jgi:mono/diheme cytochrome c family protein
VEVDMKNFRIIIAVGLAVVVVTLTMTGVGVAADQSDSDVGALIANGKASYMANCASCHGESGAGDGPVAEYLTVKPSDLTQIGTDESGEFPFDSIYEVVDGGEVAGHGSREMPVWGPAFKGMDEEAGNKVIQEKITELIYYLKSIQG